MKQIPFYKPSALVFYLFLLSFISCKKGTNDIAYNAESVENFATKTVSKPGTYPEVLVKLAINDAGNKVTSDAGGDYRNGSQNVSAKIDQYGNFIFSCGSSDHGPNATPSRWLNYDFGDPLPSYSIRPNERGAYIATIKSSIVSTPFIPFQNLEVGSTECVTIAMGLFTLADGVVNFHRNQGTEDTPNTPTAFVYVTRINPMQWIMTPVPPSSGGCSDILNVAALRVNTTLYGYYNMPFMFTLTRL